MGFCYLLSDTQNNSSKQIIQDLISGDGSREHLNSLKTLDWWIKEAVRLKLAPIGFRRVIQDIQIPDKDITIPAGHLLGMTTISAHYNAEFWSRPDEFLPDERQAAEGAGQDKSERKYAFIGFGANKRKCPGEQLAYFQVKLVLYCLFKKYQFTPQSAIPVSKWEGFVGIIHPATSYLVNIEKK
eukprot:TRINITY_DN1742_c0_g2_i2.p2 TRINITY_DN1742_c0_g2~~TRINITY_DN1742_c0_g2_i2.p2  ORF type:complete len:184 (+),score=32.14 TRINITY_DN1742_c0_g2_i2:995-1546(+)